MVTAPRFYLRTLGRLELLGPDNRKEPSLATRRRKLALLALLALNGRPLSRDRLVNLFWGDHPEERARHSLSDALSHLRRVLGPEAITARQIEVGLAEDVPLTVDLRELAVAAAAHDWPRVLALYGGPFLDGVYIGGTSDWEHWVLSQRTVAARLFVTACRAEADRLRAAADWAALEHIAVRWLEESREDPTALQLRDLAAAQLEAERARTASDTPIAMPITEPDATAPATSIADTPGTAPPAGQHVDGPRWMPARMRTRVPTRRSSLVAGALGAAILLVAITASGRHREPAAARFTFTTRSPAARLLVERASAGGDGGVSRTEAIALLQQAITLDSGFAMAYRTLALLHAGDRSGHPEAMRLLTRAMHVAEQVTPFERALIESSYHLLVTGDLSRAATAQRHLLRLAPHDGDAWHDLGMTYQYAGDETRAADAYRQALARDSSSASTWANLLDALVAIGNQRATLATLDSMSGAIPGHPIVFLTSARVHAAHENYPEAERQIRAYLASSPDAPRRQGIGELTLARILWRAGRFAEGDTAVDRAITWQLRLGDTVTALRESLAKATVRVWLRGDRVGAAQQLDAALRRFPLDAIIPEDRPLPELATLRALVGHVRTAEQTLETHVRETPVGQRHHTVAGVAIASASIALARGDVAGARSAHQRYLASPPTTRSDLLDGLYQRWIAEQLTGR